MERDGLGHEVEPVRVVAALWTRYIRCLEDLAAGAYQAVAGGEAQAEPGALAGLVEGGKPEGDLGELDGGGVQVHAVAVVGGEAGLHPGLLALVVLGRDGLGPLLLPGLEVGVGQLVHGLDEEGARAHGGLADGEGEDVVGGFLAGGRLAFFAFLPEQLLEGVLDEALGQDFRRVVAGRLLAVAAGEAEDKVASRVDDLLVVLVLDDLAFLVVTDAARRHEVGLERLALGGGLP